MTMNVYLAMAMTLSSALEGIRNKTDPGKPTDRDLYSMTEDELTKLKIRRLPRNLLQSVEALKKDELAKQVMGSVMHNSFISYKYDEWERYHQAVTDWEVQEYLRLY
jgi:glutamine synthetase